MTNEELCALARSGNANAERELIGKLLPPLQAHAAKYETQYSGIPIEADDLMQEASIGLLHAIRTFRPEMGNQFSTYASRVSENMMLDCIRKCVSQLPPEGYVLSLDAIPLTEDSEEDVSFYDRLPSGYGKTPEQILIEKETYEEIHHALDMISPRERSYLRYRYGFEDDLPHDRAETALHFHLSVHRAGSLERIALDNVRLELPWW